MSSRLADCWQLWTRDHVLKEDDRIVSLGLHLNLDLTVGYAVIVGMWWRSKVDAPKGPR